MRQKLRSVLCLFVLLLFLPVSARANGLPTSSIYVSIAGMNDGIVSVALLGNEPCDNPPQNPPEALTAALPGLRTIRRRSGVLMDHSFPLAVPCSAAA